MKTRFHCEIKIIDIKRSLVYEVRGRPAAIDQRQVADTDAPNAMLQSIDKGRFLLDVVLSTPIQVKPWKP